MNHTHLDSSTLVDLIDDLLSPEVRASVHDHLAKCAICRHELGNLRLLLSQTEQETSAQPPPDLLQRVAAAFERRLRRVAEPLSTPSFLLFDSWNAQTWQGVRGHTDEHQLLYTCAGYDLDLQFKRNVHTGMIDVRGQLLPTSNADPLGGVEVRLTQRDQEPRHQLSDELGQFSFSQLPEGIGSLSIFLDSHEISVDPLEIRC